MQKQTLHVLELLLEFDSVCKEAGIRYVSGGMVARAFNERKLYEFPKAEVYVLANELPRICELLGKKAAQNRKVDAPSAEGGYDFVSVRYVDAGTTYLDCNRFGSSRYPGIHVEIKPLMGKGRLQQLGERAVPGNHGVGVMSCGGVNLPPCGVAELGDELSGNDADGYEFENAVGFVVPFEKKWIDEAVEELYYGYPIRLPKGSSEEYAQALYAAGERVKYPSYAPAAAIIDADIAYSDVLERIEDPQAIAETISKSRVELERLNPLIDEENKTIEGDLDKVLALYDIER